MLAKEETTLLKLLELKQNCCRMQIDNNRRRFYKS